MGIAAAVTAICCVAIGAAGLATHQVGRNPALGIVLFGGVVLAIWGQTFVIACDRAAQAIHLERRLLFVIVWRRESIPVAKVAGLSVRAFGASEGAQQFGVALNTKDDEEILLTPSLSRDRRRCDEIERQLIDFLAGR